MFSLVLVAKQKILTVAPKTVCAFISLVPQLNRCCRVQFEISKTQSELKL